ncbi:free fatty acid receptor 2 [Aplochiton taeniatus]
MAVRTDLILSVYILTFLIGLPANILAAHAFGIKILKRSNPTDVLLFNLTVSDLIFLFFLPFKIYEAASDMLWNLPGFLCSITAFVFFSTIYTSSLLLMAVSVVRYIAAAFPIAYRKMHRPVYTVVASVSIWLFAAAHCTVVFITQHHPALRGNASNVCYENFTKEQLAIILPVRLEFFVVLSFIPLVVSVFCYLNCIYILSTRPRICPGKKRKAIGMALGTLAVFLVCVLPYNFSHVMGYFLGASPKWRYYTLLLSTLNTCIDPIIFYFSSSAFRSTTKISIFKMLRLHHPAIQKNDSSTGQDINT